MNESIDKVIIKFIGQKVYDSSSKGDEFVEYSVTEYTSDTYNKGYVNVCDSFAYNYRGKCNCNVCLKKKKYHKLNIRGINEQINDGILINKSRSKSLIEIEECYDD